MTPSNLRRLESIEKRIMEIAEEMGLETCDIEFDIVGAEKMLEIMAYHIPTGISNWKFGRDWERLRTIHERVDAGLPYEVVIHSDPSRAYFMKDNTFAVQVLVMAHVVGHVAVFTMNKYFQNSRSDMVEVMRNAFHRFNDYEKKYGIDAIEEIVDAGHALQFHSNPFVNETENEVRERLFENYKHNAHKIDNSEYGDLLKKEDLVTEDLELFNQKLWRTLRLKSPPEPSEDILRYIIDNSPILDDWQKDILETIREEGRYFWPMIRTKYLNEGFAVYIHERIMQQLFDEGILDDMERAQYNYSNSLVKAAHPFTMNPYLIGSKIFEDIKMRWDKGQHGIEWENCDNAEEKENWDTGAMEGDKKVINVMRTYTDWFLMQEYLTPELVDELDLYVYMQRETPQNMEIVRTMHTAKQIKDLIIMSFAQTSIPKIEVVNGKYQGNDIYLRHSWDKVDLDKTFALKTLEHIETLWGSKALIETQIGDKKVIIKSH